MSRPFSFSHGSEGSNMKLLEKLTRKATKTASAEAKKEIKKTALDLLPGILTFVGAVAGIMIFHKSAHDDGYAPTVGKPTYGYSNTRITTNNYFLGEVSEDVIKKILEDR